MSGTVPSPCSRTVILFVSAIAVLAARPAFSAEVDFGAFTSEQAPYVNYGCFQCHGYAGQGGRAARLVPLRFPYEAFQILVRKPPDSMPAYSPRVLSDEDLKAIFDYIGKLP